MYQQKTYGRIQFMDYKELRNLLRSKEYINDYKQLFNKLNFDYLYIKEALISYENIPQVKKDQRLLTEIKKLKVDLENILKCIQTLSEFFAYD